MFYLCFEAKFFGPKFFIPVELKKNYKSIFSSGKNSSVVLTIYQFKNSFNIYSVAYYSELVHPIMGHAFVLFLRSHN